MHNKINDLYNYLCFIRNCSNAPENLAMPSLASAFVNVSGGVKPIVLLVMLVKSSPR
jgi:hypothetical protein